MDYILIYFIIIKYYVEYLYNNLVKWSQDFISWIYQ